MSLPANFATWNRAARGAFLKGVHAQIAGHPLSDCPYEDKRKDSGRLTWSRSFIACWRDGWEYAKQNREDALITLQYARSFNK